MLQIDIAASCVDSVAYLYTLVHTRWLVAYAIACMKSNRATFCQTRMIHQLAKVYKTQCYQVVGDALPYVVSNPSMTDVASKLQSHSPIPINLNYSSKGHNSDPTSYESKNTSSQLPLSLPRPTAYNNTSTTLPLSPPLPTAYNKTSTTLPLSLPLPTAYNNTSTTLPLSLPLPTAYNNISTTLPLSLPLSTAMHNTSTTLPLSFGSNNTYITLSQSHFGPEYSSDNAGDGPSIKSVDSTSATRGGGRYNLRRVSLCPPSLKQREAKELTTTANKSTSSSQSKVSKDKGNTHSIVELAINTCACIIESKTYKYTT